MLKDELFGKFKQYGIEVNKAYYLCDFADKEVEIKALFTEALAAQIKIRVSDIGTKFVVCA